MATPSKSSPATSKASTATQDSIKSDVPRLFAASNNPSTSQSAFFTAYQLVAGPSNNSTAPNDLGILGDGSLSVCCRCVHRATGIEYAVKIVRREQRSELITHNVNGALLREIEVLRRCQGHPNIVQLKEVITDETHYFVVMEFLRGGALSLRIFHCDRLSEDKAKAVFKQLVSAVDFIHSSGIVHRDLKPENVIFVDDTSDDVKVIDFGFARPYGNTLMLTPRCTLNYAAPEVIYKIVSLKSPNLIKADYSSLLITDGYSKSCDLWSLGVILFQMLTGITPFQSEENITQPYSRANFILEQLVAGKGFELDSVTISPEAQSVLNALLTVDPTERIIIEELKRHPWLTAESEAANLPEKRIRLDAAAAAKSDQPDEADN